MDEHAPITYDVSVYKNETTSWDHDPSAYLLRYYKKHFVLANEKHKFKEQTPDQQPQPSKQQNGTTNEEEAAPKDDVSGLKYYSGDQYVYQSPNKLCVIGLAPSHPLLAQRDRFHPISIQFDARALGQLAQPSDKPSTTKKQEPPRCHPGMILCKIVARDTMAHSHTATASTTTTTASAASAGSLSVPDTETKQQIITPTTITDTITPTAADKNNSSNETPSDLVVFAVRAMIQGQVFEFNERLVRRGIEVIEDPQVLGTLIDKAATHGYIAVIRAKHENLDSNTFLSLEEYRTRIDPAVAASIATLPSSSKLAAAGDDDRD